MKYRLNENHPTAIKFSELVEKAEELGISIIFHSGGAVLSDREYPETEFNLEYLEGDLGPACFPPSTEVKITRGE